MHSPQNKLMAPRIKHFYGSATNRRKSLILNEKDYKKESSILQSYTSSSIRAQQDQVQKMQADLQTRERKILQDITNFRTTPNHNRNPYDVNASNIANVLKTEQIIPNDINNNTFILCDEVPSFIASPIIFKEASFNFQCNNQSEDSFLLVDMKKFEELNQIVADNSIESRPVVLSSSPNKVPVSSNLPTSESCQMFDYYEANNSDIGLFSENNAINISELSLALSDTNHQSTFASPISEKSIRRSEIELFTIDAEFLKSFEGIWCKTLDQPVQIAEPDSPDHFEQFRNVSSLRKTQSQIHKKKEINK